MKLFYKNSIVLSSLNIAVVLILAAIVFENIREDKIDNILSEKEHEIDFKGADFEEYVRSDIEKTKLLSVMPEIQGIVKFLDYDRTGKFQFDKEFWSGLLEEKFQEIAKNNPGIHQIKLFDLNGNEMIHIFSLPDRIHLETESHMHSLDHVSLNHAKQLNSGDVLVSNISLNVIDNVIEVPHRPVLQVITPILLNNEEQLGFLNITYDMHDIISKISDSASGKIVIFDNNGYFIEHYEKSKMFGEQLGTQSNYFTEQPEFWQNLQKMDRKLHHDEDEDEYRVWTKIFYDQTDDSRYWVIVSVITEKELFAPLDELRTQIQLIMIPFLIGTISISIFISRHMSKPISNLTSKILQIKKGNLEIELPVNGKDEIAELANAFNIMTKSLRQAQQTSQDYENAISNKLADIKKFNDILDQSAAISRSDLDGNFTYVNKKFCNLTKYSKEELLGHNHSILKSGYHDEEFYHNMWKKIISGDVWTGVVKNKAKDGNYFWVKLIIIPIQNSKGETIEFLGVHIDIKGQIERIQSDEK